MQYEVIQSEIYQFGLLYSGSDRNEWLCEQTSDSGNPDSTSTFNEGDLARSMQCSLA